MPRLFTGLEIPAEIGQTLSNLRGGLPGARWIDPENYHVTLRFIGDIDGIAANEIASMLFRVNRKPFEVALQGLSSFGGKKPRAVVASVVPSRPLIEPTSLIVVAIVKGPPGKAPAAPIGDWVSLLPVRLARCQSLALGPRYLTMTRATVELPGYST